MHDRTSLSLPRGAARFFRASRWQLPLFASLALVTAAGCGDDDKDPPVTPPPSAPKYEATIRRTSHGIPHITAKDMGSLGFGQAYAFAQDHVCTLADQIVKVRSERARYNGPGAGNANVGSDLAYLSLDIYNKARVAFDTQPDEIKDLLRGYVAGYNKYVAETPADQLPAPCTKAAWVKPITEVDLLAYDLNITLTGGVNQLVLAIAAATPPATTGAQRLVEPSMEQLKELRKADFGSNGWAIGAERSSTGRGMVMANPHFPWEGELKLWESQLTVPGEMNIYGVGLLGVPAVLIGFNDNIGWTHTFSSGARMTVYGLTLVPGKPTSYYYKKEDGTTEERAMTARTFSVLVKLPEGSLTTITRTLYSSHYGPIMAIPGTADWTTKSVLSVRDANIDNATFLDQFHSMNKAKSMAEFQAAYAKAQGIPWVNTMAADKDGNTWYTDASPTPNLKPEAQATWNYAKGVDPATKTFWDTLGVVLLDGSTAQNEWQNDPTARSPGLVPFSKMPQIARRDFVFNANDSYWLANPAQPLTGFSPMHGLEKVPQTTRTHMNLITLTEKSATGASGEDGKFTMDELKTAVFSNRSSTAEALRASVVERCTGKTTIPYNNKNVDISRACTILGAWNGRFDADAKGAIIWRELGGTVPELNLMSAGTFFAVPFDPANPITTPNTLTPAPAQGDDPVLVKLAQAVDTLNTAGIALDATLSSVQFTARSGTRIGLHGGMSRDGVTNVVSYGTLKSTLDATAARGPVLSARTGLTKDGYIINNGSSFVMAMQFTDSGPTAQAVLTYSESDDPKSPFFADQTQLFSKKQWRPILFTDADVNANLLAPATTITGG
ncbi:penicillin acylase family protein [Myxococcaceae bacterium JPH2]|nr:penicillin acylase family protein [Myxococcaceae bacterium JPH2]